MRPIVTHLAERCSARRRPTCSWRSDKVLPLLQNFRHIAAHFGLLRRFGPRHASNIVMPQPLLIWLRLPLLMAPRAQPRSILLSAFQH